MLALLAARYPVDAGGERAADDVIVEAGAGVKGWNLAWFASSGAMGTK